MWLAEERKLGTGGGTRRWASCGLAVLRGRYADHMACLPVSGTMPDETRIGEGARVRNTRHGLLGKALWLLGRAEGRGHLIQPLSFWASCLTTLGCRFKV